VFPYLYYTDPNHNTDSNPNRKTDGNPNPKPLALTLTMNSSLTRPLAMAAPSYGGPSTVWQLARP